MRAAELVEIGRIAHRDVPEPVPGTGEIVLRTRAVGLCGTDLKAYVRGHPFFTPPCILGHEFTGDVLALGEGVERFRIGDTVVAAPYVECGVCDACRRGVGELCSNKAFVSGALQEQILIPQRIVETATFFLPPGVEADVGTLAEPVACVLNGIERAGVRPGDTVLVVGGGPMGVLLAMVARSLQATVLISEISPKRIAAIEALGFPVADPSTGALEKRMRVVLDREDADKVLIAVGVKGAAEEAIGRVAVGGTALVFGGLARGERLEVDAYAIHYQEVGVVGSFGFRREHFREAVEWLEQNNVAAAAMITGRVGFAEIEAGFEMARRADGLKTVVMVHDGNEGE